MHFLKELSPHHLAGKRFLVRTNLDIANPHEHSLRIVKAIPTIRFLLDHEAHPIIISHRGRPINQHNQKMGELENQKQFLSLKPAIDIIERKLTSIYGSPTSIQWLENVRFDPREEKNDRAFAKELAEQADIYVNDDFAASHRASASLVAITEYLPAYAGLLLEEEIKKLSGVRDNPQHPLVVILGGIKIEDKLGMVNYLQNKVDYFLLGSAYNIIHNTLPQNNQILYPNLTTSQVVNFDLDAETIKRYAAIIRTAKTIIWNGPMGNIENKSYDQGTQAVAEAIIRSKAFSVVGGGDTIEFLISRGVLHQFSFASTGGGAMLAYLAGEKLPALEALDKCSLV